MQNSTKYPNHIITDLIPQHIKDNYNLTSCSEVHQSVIVYLQSKSERPRLSSYTISKGELQNALYLAH